jgi:hypothetical protein
VEQCRESTPDGPAITAVTAAKKIPSTLLANEVIE